MAIARIIAVEYARPAQSGQIEISHHALHVTVESNFIVAAHMLSEEFDHRLIVGFVVKQLAFDYVRRPAPETWHAVVHIQVGQDTVNAKNAAAHQRPANTLSRSARIVTSSRAAGTT